MALTWASFTDWLDDSRPILKAERDELWSNLGVVLASCGGCWRLKTADMDAIKASLAITDLTSLENPRDEDITAVADLGKVLVDLAGYDAFKAVREAEGLDSDEQLAEFVNADGRVTQVDTYHLWNLYKRVLDNLQCAPPTFQWDSVPASKTKCGHNEWPGFVSSPPKKYLKLTTITHGKWVKWSSPTSGVSSVKTEDPAAPETRYIWSGGCPGSIEEITTYSIQSVGPDLTQTRTSTFDAATCNLSGTLEPISDETSTSVALYVVNACPLGEETQRGTYSVDVHLIAHTGPEMPGSSTFRGWDYWDLNTSGVVSFTLPITGSPSNLGCGWPDCSNAAVEGSTGYSFIQRLTEQLSLEYKTSDLIAAVLAALPAFDDDWNDTPGSYRNMDSDELSLSLRQGKARIPLAGVALMVGKTYRAYYIPRFTPLTGAVVDGAETYIEFTFEADMEFTDGITVDIPADNGTTTLVGVRWECGPFA